jgi:D-3-phosphoglycerate dehydrogenase
MNIIFLGNSSERDIDTETALLKAEMPDASVRFVEATSTDEIKAAVVDADAVVVSFAVIDDEILASAPLLRCIAVSASGHGNIDMEAATRRRIAVCPIGEYCTDEVADHTMALMLALVRHLKPYTADIEQRGVWDFTSAGVCRRLCDLTLSMFGFGKIGQAVAKRARAYGMRLLAYDPYANPDAAARLGVRLVDEKTAFSEADIISNHMRQTADNEHFFCAERFAWCQKRPFFLNMGRGAAVYEPDLAVALDNGILSGAGLDVLSSENPDLEHCPLVKRKNVIITPHAAFYSDHSVEAVKIIPCRNILHFFRDEYDEINTIANPSVLERR